MSVRAPLLTARQLNRATLDRQLLLRRERLTASDAVRRVVALQAQEAPSPYIALWNRVADLDASQVDAAFADATLVKATLMRVTLHVVHASDYPLFHAAMQRTLRAARLHDPRFKLAGLTPAEVEALVPDLLAFATVGRSNAEMEAWLDARHGRTLEKPGVWWALRHFGPFVHAPSGGPWSFGPRPAYRAAPTLARTGDWEASLRQMIRRYLDGFGPATISDFCRFALIPKGWARPVFESIGAELVRLEGPGREAYWDVPGSTIPDDDVAAPPRLLPMWDSVLLAHDERGRFTPPEYRKQVIRTNGDLLPTLLVDGYVAGVWRVVDGAVEATAFHRLSDEAWEGLKSEARGLLGFLGQRELNVYGRYGRWWSLLPSVEMRRLA
jgi:hypothetical protein